MNSNSSGGIGRLVVTGLVTVLIVVFGVMGCSNSYFMKRVEATEMAVVTRGGQLDEVVDAGTYTSVGLFKKHKLETFSVAIIPLQSTDPEVMTKPQSDKDETAVGMPVGFEIVGDIQIPIDPVMIKQNWLRYGQMYKNPELLEARVDSFTKEAMKTCAGGYTFYEISSDKRTEFAQCISDSITAKVYSEYNVEVTNVTIANIMLSESVINRINSVIDLQQQVDLEEQQAELAKAEGARKEAENTANIQAEMASKIEQAKQDKLLASQEAQKVLSQQEVISAEIELIALQQSLAVEEQILAETKAVENMSSEAYMASLLQSNPNYYRYLIAQLNAGALQNVSKMIIAEEGNMPNIVMGADGYILGD